MLMATAAVVPSAIAVAQEATTSRAAPRTTADILSAKGPPFPKVPYLLSKNGVLKTELTAAPAKITVAGQTFTSNVYNGQYCPPTLVLKRGDWLELTLVNEIGPDDNLIIQPQATNYHTHGMDISPLEPGDNIYLIVPSIVPIEPDKPNTTVAPGDSLFFPKPEQTGFPFEPGDICSSPESAAMMLPTESPYRKGNRYSYRWQVPMDHSRGIFWYHPHVHGHVEDQILSGLSGMIIIDGMIEQNYPEFANLTRHRFLLKDIVLPGAKDGDPKTKTINGMIGGVVRAAPGEMQIWELGNLGADSFFDLAIDGHKLWVLGRDGNSLEEPQQVSSVFLPPSARAMVLVDAGNAGVYGIRSLEVDNGPAGDPNPEVLLGALSIEGDASRDVTLRPRLMQPAADSQGQRQSAAIVAALPVTRKRTITYTESADGKQFYIDGEEFDMSRNNVEVTLGDVEEWTILNDTDERHSFHIHQTNFLVTDINGDDEDSSGLRDVVDIPYRRHGKPGSVTVIIPFDNPLMVGRFPFHCHIVEHEDGGMMANVLLKAR